MIFLTQESIKDYQKSLKRLKHIPKQLEQITKLLKQGVMVNKSIQKNDSNVIFSKI